MAGRCTLPASRGARPTAVATSAVLAKRRPRPAELRLPELRFVLASAREFSAIEDPIFRRASRAEASRAPPAEPEWRRQGTAERTYHGLAAARSGARRIR